MDKTYREYQPAQLLLLPPNLRDWLPEDHVLYVFLDVVAQLDLSEIFASYEDGDGRGYPPFHPQMMVALLLYAYCDGKPSSRKIETATWEEVPYRVLTADQHPDHSTIAEFRRRHLKALADLFLQVLLLCREAGLVKLGHLALDGSKLKANASKRKAMSYGRMNEREAELEQEVAQLLQQAEATDAAEDEKFGKGKREGEVPPELKQKTTRLKKIREAKAALEAEAKAKAAAEAEEVKKRLAERAKKEEEQGHKFGGRPPQMPDVEKAKPEPKAQRNFTDPDSRIMKDGASGSFEQCYNAQVVVDSQAQIIVAAEITQEANDKQLLVPMVKQAEQNVGQKLTQVSADAGYYSDEAVTDKRLKDTTLYIPPDRQTHGRGARATQPERHSTRTVSPVAEGMRERLRSFAGRALYKMRKAIVEPVFGQIKECRGFRRFSFRGKEKVSAEWKLVALAHNLLKLCRVKMA